MSNRNRTDRPKTGNPWMQHVCAIATLLSLGVVPGSGAEEKPDLAKLVGHPAELSAWAYAYRADQKVQTQPEACFILRRLERLDQVYRPVSQLLCQGKEKKATPWPKLDSDWQLLSKEEVCERGKMLPPPSGVLESALLWEGRMHFNRLELHWPTNGQTPPLQSVELRVYPEWYGWFGWQSDERVTVKPEISKDGSTWVYKGDWDAVDMVAAFVERGEEAKCGVPQILAYGPEVWKRMDVEIEWGFKAGMQNADYDGRIEGFLGVPGDAATLPGDSTTASDGRNAWKSHVDSGARRGVAMPVLYIQPADEFVRKMPKFPYGHPLDTRMTVRTKSGSFTFLVRDLDKGPILAPEYGFFVTKAGSGKNAREFAAELTAAHAKSIREMTREHGEATWEEAMREIQLPMLPPGTALPPYQQVENPPMQVEVPEKRWTDAWRMGTSQLKNGELTYMQLALEAPRPIHAMDAVGLHDAAGKWLASFLDRPGTPSDGDFHDGTGNFCIGKLFHGTVINDCPGYDTYELVHNGGSGRILYDLADHYFLTGDAKWFKTHQRRMQAAADWIIRQRQLYLKDVPNRDELEVAGLHPPQHISDCAWGRSEWKWYANIDAWYCQGLRRFAEAMAQIDPDNAGKYLEESRQYQQSLRKAVDRAITLAPVMKVRDGTYRSYIPPVFYIRGPSIGQVVQLPMTDDDWSVEMVASTGIPAADDVRLDGHLDVVEDVLSLAHTYLFGGNRYQYLTEKRRERGLPATEDWFWGGASSQLGYSYLANVYLQRDDISSFLRQWVNNYAAYAMPSPRYYYLEQFMNHENAGQMEAYRKGEYRNILNGHSLSYFMEQFRSLLVWEENNRLWLAKATPRSWLAQGKKISVKNAPSYFGTVAYEIVSDADNGKITATVEMPARNPPKAVLLRLRHPKASPMKSVSVNGAAWTDFDPAKELISLHGVKGTVKVESNY
jgi:hypothetical protein